MGLPVVRVAKKWTRYGACDLCRALPSRPCVNLTVLKGGKQPARELKHPHAGRARVST